MMPVVMSWWELFGLAALATVTGFGFGMLAMWHSASEQDATPPPARPRTPGPRRAGYLAPGPNAGCYEPDWPVPGDTFSEIAAGWQRLERNVAGETQPFGRIRP